MKKGFLLIDQQKNTIILSPNDPEYKELTMWLLYTNLIKEVKQHKTKTELYLDVKKYLNNEYEAPVESEEI